MEHHRLDPYQIPEDKTPLYLNEPSLTDKSLLDYPQHVEPEEQTDNVRIYIPMDLNREAKELGREIKTRLEEIPDGCAECFPFEIIDELRQEYLSG